MIRTIVRTTYCNEKWHVVVIAHYYKPSDYATPVPSPVVTHFTIDDPHGELTPTKIKEALSA